jgi:hypothetical protein
MMAEVGVLLADDLAVELVLADRAGERAGDADGSRTVRPVAREEEALAGEQLSLEPAHQPSRHLHLHRDVAGEEHHRACLRGQGLSGLKSDDDGGRLTITDGRLHPSEC